MTYLVAVWHSQIMHGTLGHRSHHPSPACVWSKVELDRNMLVLAPHPEPFAFSLPTHTLHPWIRAMMPCWLQLLCVFFWFLSGGQDYSHKLQHESQFVVGVMFS